MSATNTVAEPSRLQTGMLHLARLAVLLLAAVLRLWRLDQDGYGNEYYRAGVRSMAASWHNFYSYAGGIVHFYYLATLAPALAALAGIGVVRLWGCYVGERVACRPASRCAAPDGRVADASRKLVDPALWRAGAGPRMQLYDLRPEARVVPAPPE